jgi:aurora kinase
MASSVASITVPAGCTLHDGLVVVPSKPKSDWSLQDFDILHKLGGGQYGTVYLASTRGTNYVVALKKLKVEEVAKQGVMSQLRREVEIAFHTRHKYLLRTYGYFYDQEDVYLILEPCAKGMLYTELTKVKCYAPSTAAKYVAQLAEALHYLHQHHVLHRDIKPENILLDHNGNIKLADFGWSVHDPKNRRKTACGTPEYFPPEIVDLRPYDSSADLWCLGIFCYELLVGQTPFFADKPKAIYENIRKLDLVIPEHLPDEAKDLIGNLLRREGADRMTMHKVLRHPFLARYYYEPNDIAPPTSKRDRDER